MSFEGLRINRLIIHEIFRREEDKQMAQPRYGEALIDFTPQAASAIANRIVTAMGIASQSLEMQIVSTSDESMVYICSKLLESSDEEFILHSKEIANKLAMAQMGRNIPGGILVTMEGILHTGRVLVVIKAEAQNGFTRITKGGALTLEFLEELFLTPQTKLYKIGAFLETEKEDLSTKGIEERFKVFIFDHGMTTKDRDKAAQYFYEAFLGLNFPQTSARLTKKFHSLTKEFIHHLNIPEEDKIDLYQALYTYLKTDQRNTISAAMFSSSYISTPQHRDEYEGFMRDKQFPSIAINKDLSEVSPSLKQKKVRFRSNIRLTAPSDVFNELVSVKTIPAPEGSDLPAWTQLTIKDRIVGQE